MSLLKIKKQAKSQKHQFAFNKIQFIINNSYLVLVKAGNKITTLAITE